jgi:RNA polymerase sigma factor (sigma-70 family)
MNVDALWFVWWPIAVRRALAEHYLPFVELVARMLKKRSLRFRDFDDLVADGVLGLMHALDHFDPAAGDDFEGYAFVCIRGQMFSGVRTDYRPPTASLDAIRDARGDVERFDVAGDDGRVDEVFAAARVDLAAALSHLNLRDRRVAELRYVDGLTLQQLGAALGVSRERARQIVADIEERIGHLLPFRSGDGVGSGCRQAARRAG